MNDYSEIVNIIRSNILFLDIKDELLFSIAKSLQFKEVKKGEVVYNKGDVVNGLYLVVSGDVLIFAERDDETLNLSHASATYLFGEFLLQGDSVRSTSAKAETDSHLLFLSRDGFNCFLGLFPEKGAVIGSRIINRLCWNQTTLALRLSHLFVGLDEEIVRILINQMELQSVPSNTVLIKQNSVSNALWVVIDGQFQISKTNKEGLRVKLAVVGRGKTIGEIGVVSDSPRRSDVLATRDSTVAKLSKESFEKVLRQFPVEINHTFVKSIAGHLDRRHAIKSKSAETFALVVLSPELTKKQLGLQLLNAFKKHGSSTVLTSEGIDQAFGQVGFSQSTFEDSINKALLQWISEQESTYRHIIYVIDNEMSSWTQRCLRQADHIIFFANALENASIGGLERSILDEIASKDIKKTLVLVHPGATLVPENTSSWINSRQLSMHHHIKDDSPSDYNRVARFLTGNAVGLVLGGGGARGFAHIGVLRAFKELNIPIDLIGGNSMGAVLAAQYAMQWDYKKMIKMTQQLCLQGDQFTLPVMSIFSGVK